METGRVEAENAVDYSYRSWHENDAKNSLEDHATFGGSYAHDSSRRVDKLAFRFCTSKDHTQLLIMHTYMRNGNGTAGMNGATASERGRTERKRHHFFDCYCMPT